MSRRRKLAAGFIVLGVCLGLFLSASFIAAGGMPPAAWGVMFTLAGSLLFTGVAVWSFDDGSETSD